MAELTPFDVQLRNVTKRFGKYEAVKQISFDVRRGQFVTLLGPSGCGKTTTLRIIGGFEQADEGEILVDGRLVDVTPDSQRRTRMVFQNYALFPHMTVQDNVAFGLRMHKVPMDQIRTRVVEILDVMGLSDKVRSFPSELSGGQQQRVALARALVTRPTVLLLDEPLGALDLKMRKRMQTELKKLQREVAITFIYVTHDQEEALALSDQIVVMDHGIIAQMGTPEEIYRNPATRYVADFIGETNLVAGSLSAREGREGVVKAGELIMRARLVGAPLELGAEVTIAVRPEQVRVELQPFEAPTLLSARVVNRVFLGPFTRLTLETENAIVMNADTRGLSEIQVGDRVYAGWSTEDAMLLDS